MDFYPFIYYNTSKPHKIWIKNGLYGFVIMYLTIPSIVKKRNQIYINSKKFMNKLLTFINYYWSKTAELVVGTVIENSILAPKMVDNFWCTLKFLFCNIDNAILNLPTFAIDSFFILILIIGSWLLFLYCTPYSYCSHS